MVRLRRTVFLVTTIAAVLASPLPADAFASVDPVFTFVTSASQRLRAS